MVEPVPPRDAPDPAAGVSVASPAPEAGWLSCPRCSRRARRGQPYCEQCGQGLTAGSPDAPDPAARAEGERRAQPCRSCGASVTVPPGERTTTCPFCDTPYVAEGEASPERYAPEFVLPFAVPETRARELLQGFLARGGWFTPGDLARSARVHAVRGVYVPCWSLSTRSESRWQARIGEYWYETRVETYTTFVNGKPVTRTRTRQVRHTEWYPLDGGFQQFHAHYLVSGSRGLTQAEADHVGPFPLAEMLRYAPAYLSGWLAEEYTVERDDAERLSLQVFAERERGAIAAFLPGDTHEGLQVQTTFHDTTTDLVYLPVWICAFRYRGRVWRFLVNGATGRVEARRPRSAPRIVAAVLLLLALAAGTVLLVRHLGRPRAPAAPPVPAPERGPGPLEVEREGPEEERR